MAIMVTGGPPAVRRRRWPLIGFVASAIVTILALPVSIVFEIYGLMGAFAVTASNIEPAEKARALSDGISLSMNASIAGLAVTAVAGVAATGFLVVFVLDTRKPSQAR